MKRLFARPAFEGKGVGRKLAMAVIEEALSIGCGTVGLETLPTMAKAKALCGALGFLRIDPRRFNPVPGTLYFELALQESRRAHSPNRSRSFTS